MAKTMRAAVVNELKKSLTIEEVPIPIPRAGEILICSVSKYVSRTERRRYEKDDP